MTAQGSSTRHFSVAIIGAGVSGICMAIRLKQAGYTDISILEKSDDIGGTWRDNTYPASGCDVPSHLYSYSFEPNPDWSHAFSLQEEILAYLRHCVDKYGIAQFIRYNSPVDTARYDAVRQSWQITLASGDTLGANILVSGVGQLNRPHTPTFPGADLYEGTTFHSARWNHEHDLSGERVAVIGNGASAVQFVPQIAPKVKELQIYQRSANWIIDRPDKEFSSFEKWLFRNVPGYEWYTRMLIYWLLEQRVAVFTGVGWRNRQFTKVALKHLEEQISDPDLRQKLTPDYPIGCKRVLISSDYYPALERPNVDLITTPIKGLTRDGIETDDGQVHQADTIIYATGFLSTDFLMPMDILGLDGKHLHDSWKDGAQAYLGMTVAGFPNFFMMYGPNTNLGHNSIIFMIECQVHYILDALRQMEERRIGSVDIKRPVMDSHNATLQEELRASVFNAGCDSWYKQQDGKIVNNWSGSTITYWRRTRTADLENYETLPAASAT